MKNDDTCVLQFHPDIFVYMDPSFAHNGSLEKLFEREGKG